MEARSVPVPPVTELMVKVDGVETVSSTTMSMVMGVVVWVIPPPGVLALSLSMAMGRSVSLVIDGRVRLVGLLVLVMLSMSVWSMVLRTLPLMPVSPGMMGLKPAMWIRLYGSCLSCSLSWPWFRAMLSR